MTTSQEPQKGTMEELDQLILAHITIQSGFHAGNNTLGEFDEAGEKIKSHFHHQLQKAREETEIAETIKAGVELIEGEKKETDNLVPLDNYEHPEYDQAVGFNQALQTAVTKLQELGQPTEVISDKIK